MSLENITFVRSDSSSVDNSVLISDYARHVFEEVVAVWTCLFIAMMGIVTNVLNCVVFVRQGFSDSVNISLMAISVWDFIRCFSGAVFRLSGPISLVSPAAAMTWTAFTYGNIYMLHVFSGSLACAHASYVAVERCLCVSVPFKVKEMITSRVTMVATVLLSVIGFGAHAIFLFTTEVRWYFDARLNQTVAVVEYKDYVLRNDFTVITYYNTLTIMFPLTSLIVTSTCTVIMSAHLKHNARFKLSSGHDAHRHGVTSSVRERKVIKMVLFILIIYIVDLTPRVIVTLSAAVAPEIYEDDIHKDNVYMTVLNLTYLINITNASTNFFIFYNMSSNFKATFTSVFASKR